MRTWILLVGVGCSCPTGFERVDGECAPAVVGDGGTSGEPLSADNFVRRYQVRVCQELERCKDEQIDSDYIEVDCDEPVDFDTDCPFDLGAAEQCLSAEWGCELYGYTLIVYADVACDAVYLCGA